MIMGFNYFRPWAIFNSIADVYCSLKTESDAGDSAVHTYRIWGWNSNYIPTLIKCFIVSTCKNSLVNKLSLKMLTHTTNIII